MNDLIKRLKETYPEFIFDNEQDVEQFFLTHTQNMPGRWYYVCTPKKLVLVPNAKTSIKSNLLNLVNIYDDIAVKEGEPTPFYLVNNNLIDHVKITQQLSSEEEQYYKYTFVRNPLSRMVSNYEYFNRYDLPFTPTMFDCTSFESFIQSIALIPDHLIDRHGRSQYYALGLDIGMTINYIGKFENITEDYNFIKNKFELKPLEHAHKGKYVDDWKKYYTVELAELVYNRYEIDFKTFGYEEEYHSFLKELQKNG
jgi:hypothetical protein